MDNNFTIKIEEINEEEHIPSLATEDHLMADGSRNEKEITVAVKPSIKNTFKYFVDILILPITYLAGKIFHKFRLVNFHGYPRNKRLLLKIGVFPIIDHYYEPLFNSKHLNRNLRDNRTLTSINMNDDEQLEILKKFNYNRELLSIPRDQTNIVEYYYNNYSFLSGDSEYLYNIIRTFKPRRVIEVGSGYSTLMALRAIAQNKTGDNQYQCEFICIEPFEHDWLEKLDVEVHRKLVEDVQLNFFERLGENDILFIDSSHMIKPQGDVLFLFMEVLPMLKPGVLIHVHDIFTPKDYLDDWVIDKNRFWNEQYLLEAYLSYNENFRIIGALNYLRHFYYDELAAKCPVMKDQISKGMAREPGSFWFRKVS